MAAHQKILVAVALHGKEDELLIQRVLSLINTGDVKLSLVHAVEPENELPLAASKVKQLETQMCVMARQKIRQIAQQFALSEHQLFVVVGRARQVIPELARELACDLIVVGSTPRNELELVLLGSTAATIMQKAPCDVLAMRVMTAME